MAHDLDEPFEATRHALHRIANHVLARAEQAATGQVGLRGSPGGFGTTTIRPVGTRTPARRVRCGPGTR